MPILTCHTLNSSQKAQIHSLEERCRKESPLTLSFPTDGFRFCLLYFGNPGTSARTDFPVSPEIPSGADVLLSAAAFVPVSEGAFECSAFTDPAFRNQGLFSLLLEEGLQMLPAETDLLFYFDGSCPDTLKTLEALEAEYLSCDYMMELLPEPFFKNFPELLSDLQFILEPDEESLDEDGLPLLLFRSGFGEALVSCRETNYYIYSFEIREAFRGRGLGKDLLCRIINTLYRRSPLPVLLQVTGDNLPALSLYKKTGFQVTDTLSTYLY